MYAIIFGLLFVAELVYFRIADKCNIIDKPNERRDIGKMYISNIYPNCLN